MVEYPDRTFEFNLNSNAAELYNLAPEGSIELDMEIFLNLIDDRYSELALTLRKYGEDGAEVIELSNKLTISKNDVRQRLGALSSFPPSQEERLQDVKMKIVEKSEQDPIRYSFNDPNYVKVPKKVVAAGHLPGLDTDERLESSYEELVERADQEYQEIIDAVIENGPASCEEVDEILEREQIDVHSRLEDILEASMESGGRVPVYQDNPGTSLIERTKRIDQSDGGHKWVYHVPDMDFSAFG